MNTASTALAVEVKAGSIEKLEHLAQNGYLFAILDSTDAPLIPEKARELGETRAVSLFRGSAMQEYWAVAPYLVTVDEAMLAWVRSSMAGEPWGVFVMARAALDDLYHHFRHFLMAQLPDGKMWYFRYYDPRILPAYLESCNAQEAEQFFGPVRAFAVDTSEGIRVIERLSSC